MNTYQKLADFVTTHAPWLVMLYIFVNIGIFLLNYNNVWVQPEEFNWREYILMDGASLSWHILIGFHETRRLILLIRTNDHTGRLA